MEDISQNDPILVGRVVATEKNPSTAYEFRFWAAKDDCNVGIGTLVVMKKEDPELAVYGVVVEGFGFTDLASAMHDYIGSEYNPQTEAPTVRPEVRCYTAAVLRVEPEEPLQPVPVGPVYLADDLAVAKALRMDAFQDKTGIPIGLYQNGDLLSPVYLDSDFLLGPEAAHLNITGVSGLATKTSSIEFILLSIFQHFTEDVAVVCFNVKGSDMLFLDFPAGEGSLDERDAAMYERLGIPCVPFGSVKYYAPFKSDRINLNTLRTHPDLAGSVSPLSWGLKDILQYTEVVLNRDDVDAKADALIQYINQRVVDQTSQANGQDITVRNFQDLNRWFDMVLKEMEESNRSEWKTHHYATIRKVYNRLTNLSTRYQGLISPDEYSSDLPWGSFEDRTAYVVDVANLDPQAQDLVFTRLVSQLRQHLEKGDLGVKHVIVVVDELNKYAPSDGQDTYLRQTLLDISERGRYLGMVLFSAQQFRSQVHKRIVGNSATCIYGRMDMDELATPGYQVLTSSTKEKLATLSKGQLMIRHPHFNQPIFVKFPRPNVLRGPDGIKKYPPADDLPLEEAVWRNLSRLNGALSRNDVKDVVASASDSDEVVRAMNITLQKMPEDAASFFRNCIRKKAGLYQGRDGLVAPVIRDADAPAALTRLKGFSRMRVVHIADPHLGYRAYNRVNRAGINAREADVFSAFREALAKAAEIKPDLILIAGDLFHVVRPSNLTIGQTYRELTTLRTKIDSPVVIIGGNHDSPRSADTGCILDLFANIPDIHIAHSEYVQVYIEKLDTSIFCLCHRAVPQISSLKIEPDPSSKYNILMVHGTVEGVIRNAYDIQEISRAEVISDAWDYIAFGHYHVFEELAPNAFYAGSLEYTSTNIWSEITQPKGFIEYDLDLRKVTFHEVETREVIDLRPIDAAGVIAADLNVMISQRAESVRGGFENKTVRLVVENLPRSVQADLDFAMIRKLRSDALHFDFQGRPPAKDGRGVSSSGTETARSLEEEWDEFAKAYDAPAGVERERLVELGRQYLVKHIQQGQE